MWCKEDNKNARGTLRACLLVATALVTLAGLASSDAFAQGKGKDAKAAAGASKGKQTPWVKICGKVPQVIPPKKGEKPDPKKAPQTKNLNICLTQQEIFDGRTGTVLVSAAIRKTEGQQKEQLEVLVPTGLAMLPFGAQGKVDDKKPFKLQFIFCHQLGCIAEAEAPKTLIDQMKTGKQLVIVVASPDRKGIAFPVPLNGFGKTYDGPPVDNAKYNEDRKKLAAEIEQRRKAFIQKLKEKAEQKKGEDGTAAAPAGKK
jgi:invasion protein IalB